MATFFLLLGFLSIFLYTTLGKVSLKKEIKKNFHSEIEMEEARKWKLYIHIY